MILAEFDLSLLLPEIGIATVITVLSFLEMFRPSVSSRLKNFLNFGGVLLVGTALTGLSGRTETTFQGMFVTDPFAIFFKFLFLGTAAGVLILKEEGQRPSFSFPLLSPPKADPPLAEEERPCQQAGVRGEFNLILWCALLGLFFFVSATDFLLFFISLELLTLSIYILAAYNVGDLRSTEAGLKYLVLGSLASAFLLYGISLIYLSAGTFSFGKLGEMVYAQGKISWTLLTGALLVISALGFKVAAVPFQVWVPDVYQGAPTPVAAFLSIASKSAGFAGLLRILFEALGGFGLERKVLFSFLASLTLLYGNLGALVQKDMKRLLGYSSIGHAGFLLIALSVNRELAGEPLLYYLVAYAVSNLAAFLVVVIVEKEEGTSLECFKGLHRRSPLLAAGFFLAVLSLAGVPPLAGFFAKFFILLAAAKSEIFWIVFLGAVNVAISLYYYLNLVRLVYFEEPEKESTLLVSWPATLLLLSLGVAIIMVGVWQPPFFYAVSSATLSLF